MNPNYFHTIFNTIQSMFPPYTPKSMEQLTFNFEHSMDETFYTAIILGSYNYYLQPIFQWHSGTDIANMLIQSPHWDDKTLFDPMPHNKP